MVGKTKRPTNDFAFIINFQIILKLPRKLSRFIYQTYSYFLSNVKHTWPQKKVWFFKTFIKKVTDLQHIEIWFATTSERTQPQSLFPHFCCFENTVFWRKIFFWGRSKNRRIFSRKFGRHRWCRAKGNKRKQIFSRRNS